MENLDDHACPRTQELVELDKGMWNYTFRHKKALQCPERKAKLFGD